MTQKHRLTFQIIRLIVGFPLIVLTCIVWGFQEWWSERKGIKSALFLLTTCLPVFAQDLYVNFEGVSAGTSASASIMGTISKTNGNAVAFSYVGTSTGISVENQTTFPGLLTPVIVAGTPYTNSNPTKALYVRPDVGGDGNLQKLLWTYAASRKVSCGFSITMTNFGSAATDFYNCGGFETGGDYGVISMVADAGVPYIQAETVGGTGADILIGGNGTSTLTIWVTTLWDSANDKYVCAFYNQTNMALMGFSTMSTTHNATVNTMGWGGTGSHTFAAGENYWLNNLILYTNGTVWPVWPGGNLQVPTNFTPTAVTAAFAAASDGDKIVLPATNTTWTSGVILSKNHCTLTSVLPDKWGTNNTKIIADGVFNALEISGDYNITTNFWITGDGSNDEATGIVSSGAHNRYGWMYINKMDVGFYAQNNGLLHDSIINDCHIAARNIFGSSYYDTYYRLSPGSTNVFVYEDFIFDWTAGKNSTSASPLFSSQEGQAFTIRHGSSTLNKAGCDLAPAVDYHGDYDPGPDAFYRPGTLLQIYKYALTIGSSSISGNKFADLRGGEALVYSNTVTGATYDSDKGVVLREEHPEDTSPYYVTNTYVFQNKDNGGAHTMAINDDGNVIAGRDYTNAAPSVLVQLIYPHPDRGQGAPASPPNPQRTGGTMTLGGKVVVQ